jgi:hypothetical protein
MSAPCVVIGNAGKNIPPYVPYKENEEGMIVPDFVSGILDFEERKNKRRAEQSAKGKDGKGLTVDILKDHVRRLQVKNFTIKGASKEKLLKAILNHLELIRDEGLLEDDTDKELLENVALEIKKISQNLTKRAQSLS